MGYQFLKNWENNDRNFEVQIVRMDSGEVIVGIGDPNTYRGGGASCSLKEFLELKTFWDEIESALGKAKLEMIVQYTKQFQ